MTKRQVAVLIILIVFVLLGVAAGIIAKQKKLPGVGVVGTGSESESNPLPASFDEYYTPAVPREATLTPTKNEAPASPNKELNSKARFFDLKADRDGFSPEIITVNRGDTVYVDFTAVDGVYDLDIPYLGAYFTKVEEGKTKRLPFDARTFGTFVFQCRDYCPRGGPIKGSLIVLP